MGCPEELLFDLVEGEEHREVALADGALSYAVASCRSGPCAGTIVLIHGVGSNASRWEEFTEQTPLREGWRIIRLDLRGHGASESREKATLEIHAADLMRVLDDAGIEKAVLVGHSLGAQIAMRAAVLYPDRIQGMVLMDPLVTSALTPSALAHRRKYPLLVTVEFLARMLNALGIRRRMPHYQPQGARPQGAGDVGPRRRRPAGLHRRILVPAQGPRPHSHRLLHARHSRSGPRNA